MKVELDYTIEEIAKFRTLRNKAIKVSEEHKTIKILSNHSIQFLEWTIVGHLANIGIQNISLLESYFDDFYYVDDLNDQEIADLAIKNKVDIAINRSGHTDKARGNIFSYKPAPVQINYLGYPGTLGQEGIDYIISDQFVIPEEKSSFYSNLV